jgi:hypothetical protein
LIVFVRMRRTVRRRKGKLVKRSVPRAVAPLVFLTLVAPHAWGGTTQSYTATGQLGMEVTAVSNLAGALPSLSSTFNVTQIPAGAMIQKAFVYAGDWNNGGANLDLVFGASPTLGPMSIQSDAVFATLYGYRWDVTNWVLNMAPAAYNFTIGANTSGNQIPGAALVVVWSHPLAATSTVAIVDGALQVGENTPTLSDTEMMTFTGLPAKTTRLHLFTMSDDMMGTNEVVDYNGTSVGGPIDENLGLGASLTSLYNLTSLSPANNVVSVTSTADHFGWIVTAALVPEPASATLLLLGLPILAAWRGVHRRRKPPH